MRTVYIDDLKEVSDVIGELSYIEDINRYRSNFMYHGLPDDRFRLSTSIQRNCGPIWHTLEKPVLRNFSKYAIRDNPYLSHTQWEQMIVGQHHGLPTRLLDWSYSALVGLHFATLERDLDNMEAHNCALWKIDIAEMNARLPQKYREKLAAENAMFFTVDMLSKVVGDVDAYDREMGGNSFVTLEPPSIDSRITNQYSYFTVMPAAMNDIEQFFTDHSENSVKYVIDKKLRWQIREILDRNNINERITYPGLEGVSQWLKRHYYYNKK